MNIRIYEALYLELKEQLELRRGSIEEMYRRGMQILQKEEWIAHKECELELKDARLQVREAHTRHFRRRLRIRRLEIEDRESRFPVDE